MILIIAVKRGVFQLPCFFKSFSLILKLIVFKCLFPVGCFVIAPFCENLIL